MSIQTIGVVGAGSMGSGIANLAALNGFHVILRDIEDRFLEGALSRMEKFMSKSVERGKMTEEQKQETLARIQITTNLEEMKDADIVIEAVLEDMALKKKCFPTGRDHSRRCHLSYKHFLNVHYGNCFCNEAPGSGCRHALFQPGTIDEVSGSRSRI